MNNKELLINLSNAYGISGQEEGVIQVLENYCNELGQVSKDNNGNLFCKIVENKDATKHIVLDAHLDEIGFVVTAITEEGFLKIAPVGGVDKRLLLSAQLVVLTKQGPIQGVISCIAPHLSDKLGKEEPVKIEEMFLDIGLKESQAKEKVQLGDFVCFDTKAKELLNGFVTGKSLDNRAGCAAVILAGKILKEQKELNCSVTLVFSSKEEVNAAGAKTAAFLQNPTHAVVVDVSFAKAPGVAPEKCGELDNGPMVGFAPVLDRAMSKELGRIAKQEKIEFQTEVMNGKTGTNAEGYLLNCGGVKTAVVSVPLKNMHSQIEIVSMKDIENTAKLLATFVAKGEF